MNRRLEDILRKNEQRLERIAGGGSNPRFSAKSSIRTGSRRQWLLAEEPEEFFEPGVDYFQPGGALLGQIYKYIFHSSHVQTNPAWRETAGNTLSDLDPDDPEVNAYAEWNRKRDRPAIKILGGAMAFSRLCGLAIESSDGRGMGGLCSALAQILLEQQSRMTPEAARLYAVRTGLYDTLENPVSEHRAGAVAAGVMAGIIAHELGHVVYGHIHSTERYNGEISRSMERDADSFAAAVISSSPWGDYPVAGMVVWNVALAWSQHLCGEAATTHPHAAERALDLIRANESQAAQAGLDVETVMKALPGGESRP